MFTSSRDSPPRPGLPPDEAAVPDDRVPAGLHICPGRFSRHSDGRQGFVVVPSMYTGEHRSWTTEATEDEKKVLLNKNVFK